MLKKLNKKQKIDLLNIKNKLKNVYNKFDIKKTKIDKSILDIVCIFNYLGINTQGSCGGHFSKLKKNLPYLEIKGFDEDDKDYLIYNNKIEKLKKDLGINDKNKFDLKIVNKIKLEILNIKERKILEDKTKKSILKLQKNIDNFYKNTKKDEKIGLYIEKRRRQIGFILASKVYFSENIKINNEILKKSQRELRKFSEFIMENYKK